MMQTTIGATEARNHFGNLLKRVHGGREHLVVEKGGIPVAALIGIREYEAFVQWRTQEEARALGRAMAERADGAGINEAQLAPLLEDDRKAVFQALYGC